MLTEDEKLTLGMVLREKIVETHEVEKMVKKQLADSRNNQSIQILNDAIKHVTSVREDCYSIAVKLSIK